MNFPVEHRGHVDAEGFWLLLHSSPLRCFLPATYHESRSPVTAPVDVTDISHHANEQPSEITSTRAKLTDPSGILLSCQSDNYSSTCTLCRTVFILQSPDGSGVLPKLVQVLVYHTGATCCLPPTCLMLRTIHLVNKWGSFPSDHCSPPENSIGHSASRQNSLVSQPRSTEPFKPTITSKRKKIGLHWTEPEGGRLKTGLWVWFRSVTSRGP